MACGTPVVVTDGGATDDFCPPGAALRVPAVLGSQDNQEGGVFSYREPELDAVVEAMAGFGGGPGIVRAKFDAAVADLLLRKSWAGAAAQLRSLMD
jgi:glycosyltransferase involved in cell wall biosynthesis